MRDPAAPERPPLFRENFHRVLMLCRDACRGDGDTAKEMDAVGQLVEMTYGRVRALEYHLKWADELLACLTIEDLSVDHNSVEAWRVRWAELKERQL